RNVGACIFRTVPHYALNKYERKSTAVVIPKALQNGGIMCSTVNLKTKVTKTFFADLQPGPLELDYNIPAALAFTHPELPVLVVKNDKIEVVSMEWGIMPLFVNDPAERSRRRLQMINAQSERILNDKNSYWYRLRNHRCLIPLTGIFEHRKIAGWKKKVPYFVTTS